MNDAQKDEIANYLFQYFVEEKQCERPSILKPHSDTTEQTYLKKYLNRDHFQQADLGQQSEYLLGGVLGMNLVLHLEIRAATIAELKPTLAEFMSGKSKTLRPLVDILVTKELLTIDVKASEVLPMKIEGEKAWKGKYLGTRHELLLHNIRAAAKLGKAYGNSGAIIQSSGYGKSRTVDQMATLIPTILMNIRDPREAHEGAYPPADDQLFDALKSLSVSENPLAAIHLFFTHLFTVVLEEAQHFDKQKGFTQSLYEHLTDGIKRSQIYRDLSKRVLRAHYEGDEGSVGDVSTAYEKLAEYFSERDGVEMIISMDEAHTLSDWKTKQDGKSMYEVMLQATADYTTINIFFLFLSTASRIEVLASKPSLSNSARFQSASADLVAPFTEMPFDCHRSLIDRIKPGSIGLGDVQRFDFAVPFGRPLFWAYYEAMLANGTKPKDARKATMNMAGAKLTSGKKLHEADTYGKLAVLDMVLNLNYDPQRTHTHELASKLVASHMRTVYTVPTSRAYMHTGYPSEPMLADAALSRIMPGPDYGNLSGTNFLPLFRDLDQDASLGGAIDKGERGENVGKMILMLAYMDAVKADAKSASDGTRFWGHGCSLVSFLNHLTSDDHVGTVLNSVPDNILNGKPLKTVFANSWVRFTHFARAADDSVMTSHMAWIAFTRGMAMIGWRSQNVIDVLIPVLIDKYKPISEANMTGVLVQFKLRSHASPKAKVAMNERAIKFFPQQNSRRDPYAELDQAATQSVKAEMDAYLSRPYISLVMELGVVHPSDAATIPSKVVDSLDKRARPKQETPVAPKAHKDNKLSISKVIATPAPEIQHKKRRWTHPRYSLFYHGCSSTIYRCIPKTDEARQIIRTLLQLPTIFNDQPQDRSIETILEQKPLWAGSPSCFNWICEPYYTPNEAIDEDADEVTDSVVAGTTGMVIAMDVDIDDDDGDAMDTDL